MATSKEELIKSLEKLKQKLGRLKSYAQFQNRSRIIKKSNAREFSEEFEQYFYDLLDDDWKISPDYSQFYIRVYISKPLKKENAENEFNNIVDRMSEIRDRLIDEGFNSQFMIFFNERGQQESNPATHKTDIYIYKGIGERDYLHNRSWNDEQVEDKYPISDYFLCRVEFYII